MAVTRVLLILGAGALAWAVRRAARGEDWRRAQAIAAGLLAALVVICLPVTAHVAAWSLERSCTRDAPSVDAQAIVVLSGWAYPPTDELPALPATDTLYRCLRGWEIYRQARRPVFVTGGAFSPRAPGLALADVMASFLARLGVPKDDLVLDPQSRNTYENAARTAELLRQRGIRRVVLVTDAMHMSRAARCFRAMDVEVVPAASRRRSDQWSWSWTGFLPDPRAAVTVEEAVHEWVGIAWYRIRYGA